MSLGKNVKKANIYQKISTIDPPFWGLTKNRIDQLKAEAEDFYVQFDHNGGSVVLTSAQIYHLLAEKKVASDGDYKITLADFSHL